MLQVLYAQSEEVVKCLPIQPDAVQHFLEPAVLGSHVLPQHEGAKILAGFVTPYLRLDGRQLGRVSKHDSASSVERLVWILAEKAKQPSHLLEYGLLHHGHFVDHYDLDLFHKVGRYGTHFQIRV